MGFPRACRLTRKQQFDRVLKERTVQIWRGPFRVYAATNVELCARLGLIIGKRQAKRAVDRNRIKRALRESFRSPGRVLPAVDIVVQLVDSAPPESLFADAHSLWPLLCNALEKEHGHQRPT